MPQFPQVSSEIQDKVLSVLSEFTKSSPMGSITTGMLILLIKPPHSTKEFEALLERMQEDELIIGIPKGKTKRWKLD